MCSHSEYLRKILLSRVYDVAVETPLEVATALSRKLGNTVLLKREDLQPIFSFKIRGAYNKMSMLNKETLAKGVVTASAGNHAQGVALSASKLGCKAVIVMPVTTPPIKIDAVRRLGGIVELHGESFSEAGEYAEKLVEDTGAVYIPPFEDEDVIAGQGTVGMEILRQYPADLDAIFVPVGGGGLAAGVAAFIKNVSPEIRVIGVEPVDSNAMAQSIDAGCAITLSDVGLFADGVAVKQVGKETLAICKDLLDEIVIVDTDAICGAIKDIFEATRVVAEPAGALALAGLRSWVQKTGAKNKVLAAIVSGANMNFDRLSHVVDRAEIGAGQEALVAILIPEKIGTLRELCKVIGNRNITELCTRFSDPQKARVLAGIKITHPDEIKNLIQELKNAGFTAVDLSGNELAKLHLRHMVGGNSPELSNERLFRFTFPEKPGALLNFMEAMKVRFNITLFQYRYHGADFGRVLLGFSVPEDKKRDFEEFLKTVEKMGYPSMEETANPAYSMFLGWHSSDV